MSNLSESFKIEKPILDKIRDIAKREHRSLKAQVEIFLLVGIRAWTSTEGEEGGRRFSLAEMERALDDKADI